MKYYRVMPDFGVKNIKEVEVEKETDKSVWIDGGRVFKKTDWDCYVKTRKEAVRIVVEYFKESIEYSKRLIKNQKGNIESYSKKLAEAKKELEK